MKCEAWRARGGAWLCVGLGRLFLICALLSALLFARPLNAQDILARMQADDGYEEIVYIDSSGYLRVYDHRPGPNPPRVEWHSQNGGYIDLALGDVNLDGDLEIIAIGGDTDPSKNMGRPRLVVFDPVVATADASVDGYINGIPWAELYRRECQEEFLEDCPEKLRANLRLVDAGNLLAASPGDEIIYVAETPADHPDIYDKTQVTLLSATSSPVDGTAWTEHVDRRTFNEEWSWLRLGDIDKTDQDEIILVDNDRGLLRLYRDITGDPIFERHNENNRWRAAVIGDFRHRSEQDLFAIRSAQHGFSTFWVFQYRNGEFRDDFDEWLQPAPGFIFAADVEGTEGEEAFMLRDVPASITNPRLISRDENGSTIIEDTLDSDNGYKAGAGGNVAADPASDDAVQDPRDEIVIIRDNAMRIYLEPHAGNSFVEIDVSTNSRSIRIGDLDAAGFPPGFWATPSIISAALEQGIDNVSRSATLINAISDDPLPYSLSVENESQWVNVKPVLGATPADLTITYDANGLSTGIYRDTVAVISSNDQVAHQPFYIPVTLNVLAGLNFSPTSAGFIFPCDEALQEALTRDFVVSGENGETFFAQAANVDGSTEPLDWINVLEPNTGVALPGVVKVRVDPTRLEDEQFLEANVVFESDGNPPSRREAYVYAYCDPETINLPLIRR